MNKILEPQLLQGKYVNLREVELNDAEFILSLRCDEQKSKFLHKTENNLLKQIEYLKKYKTLDNEWYFIIENKQDKPIGTYRIYDLKENSFCIGSWLMINGAKIEEVIEGDYLAKNYGFAALGFSKIHFDVRKDNIKVVRYHKMYGAKIVDENDIDYFLELTKKDFKDSEKKLISWI